MSGSEESLAAVAQGQAGAFTWAQVRLAGFSARQAHLRLERGLWRVVHPGVLRAATTQPTRQLRAAAGLLYAGPSSRFSFTTGARLFGLDVRPAGDEVWLAVPHGRRRPAQPGVRLVQSRYLPPPVHVSGFPVNPLPRVVIDLGLLLDAADLAGLLYELTRQRLLAVDDILAAATGLGGRPGLCVVRRALAEFSPEFESQLEAEAAERFATAGLVLTPQHELWDGPFLIARLDFADEERKLAVEIDGHAAHSTREALESDARRDRRLRRLGWQTLRFRAADVRRGHRQMIADIVAMQRLLDGRRHPTRAERSPE